MVFISNIQPRTIRLYFGFKLGCSTWNGLKIKIFLKIKPNPLRKVVNLCQMGAMIILANIKSKEKLSEFMGLVY
ncbi:hypothetical protein HZS_357 [Henneguya salminicola]|nr:hypothetical protein HZS_357 [Henneguya salminicola]